MTQFNLETTIHSHAGDVVSFDIFDTLILRPGLESRDTFFLIEKEIETELKYNFSFQKIRKMSEKLAREKIYSQNPEREELTLDEIYDEVILSFGVNADLANRAKEMEIDLEIALSEPRKSVKKLYELAKDLNKRICLVSDMYLPKAVVEEILKKCGYSNYEKLYLSSDYLLSKSRTGLWDVFVGELKRDSVISDASEILHIGDNKRSDFEIPTHLGVSAHWIHSTRSAFATAGRFGSIVSDLENSLPKAFSVQMGSFANYMYDNVLDPEFSLHEFQFGQRHRELGAAVGGPLLLNIAIWLMHECNARGYKTIYMLSRDGYTPMHACNIVFPLLGADINIKYLKVSRRALYSLNVRNRSDIILLDEKHRINPEMTYRQVIETRFHFVDKDLLIDALSNAGITELDDRVTQHEALVSALMSCSDEILDAAKLERERLVTYFNDLIDDDSFVLFDLGYHGSTQRALSELARKKIPCFYFYAHKGVVDLQRSGYVAQAYLSQPEEHYLQKQIVTPVIETMFCEHGPSLLEIQWNESNPIEVYEKVPGWGVKGSLKIGEIQEGIISYVSYIAKTFGPRIKFLFVEPSLSYLPLEVLQKLGTRTDKNFFADICYENAITGETRYLDKARFWRFNRVPDRQPEREPERESTLRKLLRIFEASVVARELEKIDFLRKCYIFLFYRQA